MPSCAQAGECVSSYAKVHLRHVHAFVASQSHRIFQLTAMQL